MASQSIPVLTLTYKAIGAVGACRGVGFNGAQASTKGQKIFGVSGRKAADGETSDLNCVGTTVVETGGEFAVGASLIVDVQGRAVETTGKLAIKAGATAVTSSAANGDTILSGGDLPEYVFADALAASGSAGQFVEVLLRR